MVASSCKLTRLVRPGGVKIVLAGMIDETMRAQELARMTRGHGVAVFDLGGVSRMTSFGIREWMTAIADVASDYYCFIRCQAPIVSQFNMIDGFAGSGEVISVYAPYLCNSCGAELDRLVDFRDEFDLLESMVLPPMPCPNCSEQAVFDDVPEIYFQYVRTVPRPTPPAVANTLIDGSGTLPGARMFAIKKRIENTVTAFWLSGVLDKAGYFKRAADGVQGDVAVVAADLDAVEDDGLFDLLRFLRTHDLAPWLARLPASLTEAFSRAIRDAEDVRIASVQLPFVCTECNAILREDFDSYGVAQLRSDTSVNPPCFECHGATERAFPRAALAAAAKLPLSQPPEALQRYLLGNQGLTPSSAGVVPVSNRDKGELLLGKYRVSRVIGRGGMGEILLARQVGPANFEKQVVLKRINRDILGNPAVLQSFLDEARIAARLSHPNIVQIFDFGRQGHEHLIAMEYVEGIDLRAAMHRTRLHALDWPIELCCRAMSDVLAGLHAAHIFEDETGIAAPIIHRDVSPANILMSTDGAVKLVNFGIAKAADSSDKTEPGVFKGKHSHAAPEQLLGSSPIDARTDIYSTGAVLYECLTGARFRRLTPGLPALAFDHLKQLPSPREHRADIPEELERIFMRATQFEPNDRYPDAQAFRNDLEAILRGGRYATSEDLAAWVSKLLELPDDPPPRTVATTTMKTEHLLNVAKGQDEPSDS